MSSWLFCPSGNIGDRVYFLSIGIRYVVCTEQFHEAKMAGDGWTMLFSFAFPLNARPSSSTSQRVPIAFSNLVVAPSVVVPPAEVCRTALAVSYLDPSDLPATIPTKSNGHSVEQRRAFTTELD
jgi:hypothetical protein